MNAPRWQMKIPTSQIVWRFPPLFLCIQNRPNSIIDVPKTISHRYFSLFWSSEERILERLNKNNFKITYSVARVVINNNGSFGGNRITKGVTRGVPRRTAGTWGQQERRNNKMETERDVYSAFILTKCLHVSDEKAPSSHWIGQFY